MFSEVLLFHVSKGECDVGGEETLLWNEKEQD